MGEHCPCVCVPLSRVRRLWVYSWFSPLFPMNTTWKFAESTSSLHDVSKARTWPNIHNVAGHGPAEDAEERRGLLGGRRHTEPVRNFMTVHSHTYHIWHDSFLRGIHTCGTMDACMYWACHSSIRVAWHIRVENSIHTNRNAVDDTMCM